MMALGFTLMLMLALLSLTSVVDRANTGVDQRLEAEHSGQATLEHVLRDLQTATAFYKSQATPTSIGYRIFDGGNRYYRLVVNAEGKLEKIEYLDDEFDEDEKIASDVISDGINDLRFRYFAKTELGNIEEITPGETTSIPMMFYMIEVDFTVRVGNASVHLGSAVSTLNVTGSGEFDEVT